MTSKIYLEPLWKMHTLYKDLIEEPPPGYEFVLAQSLKERLAKTASRFDLAYSLQGQLLSRGVPVNILSSFLDRFRRLPGDIKLIYSNGHLVFKKRLWVVDLEYVSLLAGGLGHFQKWKRLIEESLASGFCRKVICWHEAARKTVLMNLDDERIEGKTEVVYFTVRPKKFRKEFNGNKVRLLFVGSSNIRGEFRIKGGVEVLEAFKCLSQQFSNVELVVRSDIPPDLKREYLGIKNLRIIDEIIPREQLEQEFRSADIFILPAHNTPFLVFFEAMSYELPIVTVDVWANAEIVEDGRTGLTAKGSSQIPYYAENWLPNFSTPEFTRATEKPDQRVVEDLIRKTSLLIEYPELRRRLGRAARYEIEHGRFSIGKRNEKLKRILDEAVAQEV